MATLDFQALRQKSEGSEVLVALSNRQEYEQGFITATGYLYRLVQASENAGHEFKISNVDGFCKEVGISRAAFYKAAKAIEAKLDISITGKPVKTEAEVRDRLQVNLGGFVEIKTPVGRIDLLTENEIIEVKLICDWKAALGQVLAYSSFYPSHAKRLHLFYEKSDRCFDSLATSITKTCQKLSVSVTFEEVEA